MSSHCNPNIVEDGLVFLYDVDDIQSYKGEPTENLFATTAMEFDNDAGTYTNDIATGTDSIGNYFIKDTANAPWWSGLRIYNNSVAPLTAGVSYVLSFECRSPQSGWSWSYDANASGGGWSGNDAGRASNTNLVFDKTGGISYTSDMVNTWQRVAFRVTMKDSSVFTGSYAYPHDGFFTNTNNVKIYYRNAQLEVGKSHATPFVNGTRSATQGLLDRTGNSTIDISNASFDSNAQMTFDGTDDDIDVGTGTSTSYQRTIEMVFKTNSLTSYTPLACYTRGGGQSVVSGKRMWLGFQNSKFQMHGWGTTDPASTTTIQTGKYYHAVYAYDQTTKKHYIWINGSLENNTTNNQSGFTGWNSSGDHKWFVGGDPDHASWFASAGRSLNGEIPIFKVYDKILSNEEVLQNYKSIKSRFNL